MSIDSIVSGYRSSKPPASIILHILLVILDCCYKLTIYDCSNLSSALRYVPVIRNEKIVSYKTAYFGKIHLGVARTARGSLCVLSRDASP